MLIAAEFKKKRLHFKVQAYWILLISLHLV